MPKGSNGVIQNVNVTGIQEEKVIAKSVIHSSTLEPTTFHLVLICISIILGNYMLKGLKLAHPIFSSVPVFPLGMIGGLLIQVFMKKTKCDYLVDRMTVDRIQGISLDIMVASAVATIKVNVVIKYTVPLLILFGATLLTMLFCTWFVARIWFKTSWFEKGLAEWGSATGVIATALLLLRMVDPDYKTDAPQSFAFSRPLISPFIGGGLITSIMPILAYEFGIFEITMGCVGVLIALFVIAYFCKWLTFPSKQNLDLHRVKAQQ